MYPHRIRLRGPWDFKPVERLSGETLPVPGKMTMPCHWKDGGLENFAGSVQFTRKFGYPGQIDSFERVWLTFEGLSENATVTLNGKELGSVVEKDCPHEFEITSHLQKRNELNVILFSSHPEGGLWGEVALEIRRTAFLKNCQAKIVPEGSSSKIVATGKIVGSSERPLDLYLQRDRINLAYASILPRDTTPFELVSDPMPKVEATKVRLDLIDGGVVWYTLTLRCVE